MSFGVAKCMVKRVSNMESGIVHGEGPRRVMVTVQMQFCQHENYFCKYLEIDNSRNMKWCNKDQHRVITTDHPYWCPFTEGA